MIEVSKKGDTCFVVVRKMNNNPGVAAVILSSLKEAGINIESLQAIVDPKNEQADVFTVAVGLPDVEKTVQSIERANGEVGGERPPLVVKNLAGIIIRGVNLGNSTDVFRRVFEVCGKLGINVAMTYTTPISLNIYIKEKVFVNQLIDNLRRELKEE